MKRFFLFIVLVSVFIVPSFAFADTPFPFWGAPLLSCDWDPNTGLPECTSFCDMVHTGIHIVQFLLTIGIFVALPIAILVSGFLIMTAGNSPDRLSRGRNAAKGVAIGLAIALGSYVIVSTILFALGALTTSSGGPVGWPNISC